MKVFTSIYHIEYVSTGFTKIGMKLTVKTTLISAHHLIIKPRPSVECTDGITTRSIAGTLSHLKSL